MKRGQDSVQITVQAYCTRTARAVSTIPLSLAWSPVAKRCPISPTTPLGSEKAFERCCAFFAFCSFSWGFFTGARSAERKSWPKGFILALKSFRRGLKRDDPKNFSTCFTHYVILWCWARLFDEHLLGKHARTGPHSGTARWKSPRFSLTASDFLTHTILNPFFNS